MKKSALFRAKAALIIISATRQKNVRQKNKECAWSYSFFCLTFFCLVGLGGRNDDRSRKSPDSAVNKFKLKLINHCLAASNSILGDQYRPFEDFDHFEEDDLPTNSDIVLVLSQYLSCLEKLRADNIQQKYNNWHLKVQDGGEDVKAAPPRKLKPY